MHNDLLANNLGFYIARNNTEAVKNFLDQHPSFDVNLIFADEPMWPLIIERPSIMELFTEKDCVAEDIWKKCLSKAVQSGYLGSVKIIVQNITRLEEGELNIWLEEARTKPGIVAVLEKMGSELENVSCVVNTSASSQEVPGSVRVGSGFPWNIHASVFLPGIQEEGREDSMLLKDGKGYGKSHSSAAISDESAYDQGKGGRSWTSRSSDQGYNRTR